jgi:hypothetical protein
MASQDPRLIRLVAARYRHMQGLRTIADAGSPLLMGAALSLMNEEWHVIPFAVVFSFYLVARWTWLNRRIERYYVDRFGRTGTWLSSSDLGLTLGMVIGQNSMLRDLFQAPARVRVALIMVALCVYPLWISVRDFPYRSHWLLLVAVGVGIALRIPGVPSGDAGDYWYRDSMLAIALGLLVVGTVDHLQLVRVLGRGARAADTADDAVRQDFPPSCPSA